MLTTKNQYLLRGHLRCRQCGRSYVGAVHTRNKNDKRYYRCLGKLRLYAPLERCHNRSWSANKLETIVWNELANYLSDRDLIANKLEKQRQSTNQLGTYETELEVIERQLRALDREQKELLDNALRGFPESLVISENKKINGKRETLIARKAELKTQIKASKEAVINVPNLERFVKDIQAKLPTLDFEGKRLALDMLGITVWLDGEDIEATGTIEPEKQVLRCTSKRVSIY